MVKLDVVKAAFSGFGVIGRNPLAVLAWAVFLGVVGVLPALAMAGSFVNALLPLIEVAQTDAEPSPQQIWAILAPMLGFIPILMITGLITRVVMTGAVFRAVLYPNDSGWFYLRLGARELWLALLYIVVGILSFFVWMIGGFMTIIPTAILASAIDDPVAQMLVIRVAMAPLYILFIFLTVRFCMAFPMSFAESNFRLIESWSLTRGNGWRIFLMMLLLFAFVIVVEIVVVMLVIFVGIGALSAGAMSGRINEEALTAFFSQPPSVWMQALMPWIIGLTVVGSILAAIGSAIFIAPLAEAYRQLNKGPEPGL